MATSKKPTGLQIDRKGNKYIFSWQKPQTYEDGQRLVWIYKATKTHKSDVIKLGKSAKNYTVTSPSKLKEISFKVKGNHDQDSKDPGWSDWASKSFDVHPPKKPTVSAAWSAGTPDKTTFTYTAKDEEHYPFDHVEYRTKWIKDFNGKPASYSWTGAVSTSSSKTGTLFNSTETIPAGQSYTRVVQCRSVGPGGVAKDPWVFKWHTYAKPNAPVITSTKGTVQDTTRGKITLNLSWKTSAPSSRPIDKIVIEYLITAPGADMSVPAGTNFQEADTPAKKGANSWAEEIDSTLADDQVLFARIHVYHDTREDWSDPVIALKGRLAAPTGVSITPTQSTHTITVNATNASTVPDSYLAVVYRLRPQFEATFAIIPHGSSTVNMVVPEWTDAFAGGVAVYAVVGDYTVSPVSSEGTRIYTIAEPQMTSDRVWKGVLSAPTINVVQSDIESTAIVTWEWTNTSVTGAEVSWSDHEDAWDSTDEPETFVVNNSRASRLSVSGLETGIDLYFRVRLMQTVGDDTSYGLYSDTFVLNLASAPAIPVLEMSSQVIDPAGEAIASWVYISRDNSMQAHATIVEVDTSTTPWTYTPILQADEEQQAVIRPSDLEWSVGDYMLAVQVQSGSGRFSELSDPVPVTVREPLTCSIGDTSLVYDSIPVNPEEYTGNPITFDSEDQEKEVLSLDVELLPVQEGSGTPSPQNIRPITGRTQTDVVDRGVNQWDEEWESGRFGTNTGAKINGNGIRSKNKIKVLPNTAYHIIFGDYGTDNILALYYDANGDFISYDNKYSPAHSTNITTPSNAYYININIQTSSAVTTYNHDISVNYPSTDTGYHAYNGQTYSVTLPHTVYGADVDVTGGESKETWQNIASYNGETISEPWLSSMDEYVQGTTPTTGAQVCYELATPTDLQTTPTDVELLTGVNNISADGDMELTIADAIDSGYFLKGMPMTATVTGAGETGQTILMIKRKADYVILRPDDTELIGHADEVICQHVYTGEAEQTISIDEVQGKLNDGATYYLEATVTDDLGREAHDRYPADDPDDFFKVVWDEQAIMPEATAEIINDDYAKLTITKPQDWADGDVVDIYRMTSDKPQKIAEDVEMDDDPVEYVDPYPTLGENGGYRFVYKTINGDDTLDADDNFAWLDVKAVCHSAEAIIDFNGERIPLPYNLKVSNSWGKDFQETRYLGGHIAGDWTAGVSRSGSIDSVTVPINDPAVFRSIRRLAEYTDLCHVRTLDGSVMTCNVDVDDDFGYDTAGKIQSVKLDFTRVDPVDLDAVPLADWLVTP